MKGYSTTRWRKYGNDRLYVTAPDGTKVGWICLKTGQKQIDALGHWAGFDEAVAEWHRTAGSEDTTSALPPPRTTPDQILPQPVTPSPEPLDETDEAWIDLATTRPGAAAREQAVALRKQAPVRTFVQRVLGVHTEERAWRIGADGEEAVGRQLAKLGDGWHHLHAVRVGDNGADIDHVVIGPPGVFTINTKHHPGGNAWVAGRNVRINGQAVPYIRNSMHEAIRAGRLLTAAAQRPVEPTAVIVFVGLAKLTVRERPEQVTLCEVRSLQSLLRGLPAVLSPAAVERSSPLPAGRTPGPPEDGQPNGEVIAAKRPARKGRRAPRASSPRPTPQALNPAQANRVRC